MENNTPQWKPIKGFEGLYEISNHGQVRSLSRTIITSTRSRMKIRGRMLSPIWSGPGTKYGKVSLHREGERVTKAVHRLVAQHFIGDAPEGKPFVCHQDGNTRNNHVDNLRWDDHSGNMLDVAKHGGRKLRGPSLTKDQTRFIQNSDMTLDELSVMFGVHQVTISQHRHKNID